MFRKGYLKSDRDWIWDILFVKNVMCRGIIRTSHSGNHHPHIVLSTQIEAKWLKSNDFSHFALEK